LAANVTPD
ncbi:unnamed protein product, partial [Caretta caretta]